MLVEGLQKILRTNKINQNTFFFFFTILLNIRLVFIINNFVFNSPLASKVISVIIISGFVYYLPFFLKILKHKPIFIIFILLNLLGIYYGFGRYINGMSYAITLYLKQMPMSFLVGITTAYLSFQHRLKENIFILCLTCFVLIGYLISIALLGTEWGTGGILRGASAADALFQTVGFYTVVTLMPIWLYIKINYYKIPPKVLNTYKNIFAVCIIFLLGVNFMCGSKKDLVILITILILTYIDEFNFFRNFSYKIKKYYILNYIVFGLTFYLLSRNDDIGDNSIFFYENLVLRVTRSITNRLSVISELFFERLRDTFPFGNPAVMDFELVNASEPYIHSSIINVLFTCGIIGLIMWLYITLVAGIKSFKFSTPYGLLFSAVVFISMIATSFDWQLFWYFIGLTCGVSYLKNQKQKISYT